MKWRTLLAACLIVLLLPFSSAAQSPLEHGKAYIVLVDKLSAIDIDPATTPALAAVAMEGAIGLASTRTLGRGSTEDGSLTIGAGNLARTPGRGLKGYNRDETVENNGRPAEQLYHSLTGIDAAGDDCLLVNLPEVIGVLAKQNVTTRPGAMGEILRRHNLKVCVLGNGDTHRGRSRPAVSVAMDASGRVPLGNVGMSNYLPATEGILDVETNYATIKQQITHYRSQADVIVIELSDLHRMEKADTALPEIQLAERGRILSNIDSLVGWLGNTINPSRVSLVVISPSPATERKENKDTFIPVLIRGSEYSNGILTSGSTRRDYIVANTDIAPTVLSFFGLKDEDGTMIGQPILAIPAIHGDKLEQVKKISNLSSTTNRLRAPLVKGYVFLQIAIIMLALLAILLTRKPSPIVPFLVLSLATVPLILLPLGRLNLPYDWNYILVAITATAFLTLLLAWWFKSDYYRAFVFLCLLTLLALNLDILSGTTLIETSVMGYDAMAGARYYGLGNEYGGVLLGCTLIVAASLHQRFPRPWMLGLLAILFASQCYLIATPSLGASADGAITAPVAFLLTLALLANVRVNWRTLSLIGTLVMVAVVGLAAYDATRPAEIQSHIGRAANQIITCGWQEGITIIARKIGMNLKLIRYTVWSRVFLVILASLAILVYRPAGAMAGIKEAHPSLMKGFAGIVSAAIVGLIINDSGIVAAATTSIYIVTPILILMLKGRERNSLGPLSQP